MDQTKPFYWVVPRWGSLHDDHAFYMVDACGPFTTNASAKVWAKKNLPGDPDPVVFSVVHSALADLFSLVVEANQIRLKAVASVKVNDEKADLWLQRQGDASRLGRPSKEYRANWWGVTVTDTDRINPGWLFYAFQLLYDRGHWQQWATGSTGRQQLRKKHIQNIQFSPGSGALDIEPIR